MVLGVEGLGVGQGGRPWGTRDVGIAASQRSSYSCEGAAALPVLLVRRDLPD